MNIMDYKVEFQVRELIATSIMVEADSPEEALKLARDEHWNYDRGKETLCDSSVIPTSFEVVGEWQEDGRLKRFETPVV
jgi:hypothetical protein